MDYNKISLTQEEINEQFKKATKKIVYDKFYSHILEGINSDSIEIDDRLSQVFDAIAIKREQCKSKFVLITVNPKEDDLPLLKKSVEKFVKHKWIKAYMYCFEQRGGSPPEEINSCMVKSYPDKPNGFHAHIVIAKEDYEPCKVKRETISSFKKIPMSSKAINFKWATKPGNFVSYVMKTKPSDEQKPKTKLDEIWREKENLQPYYSSNESQFNL